MFKLCLAEKVKVELEVEEEEAGERKMSSRR